MIIDHCEQGSDEWFAAKCGIASSTNFDKVITTTGKLSKQAEAYMDRLAGERILERAEETYQSPAMLAGIEMEAEARLLFEMITDKEVEQVGVVYKDSQKKILCSPDGLIHVKDWDEHLGKKAEGLEIKCPLMHTHVGYLRKGVLPTKYFNQVQGSLYVTGLHKWNFLSYYPGLPHFLIMVRRDEKFIAALDVAMTQFCDDLDKAEEQMRKKI